MDFTNPVTLLLQLQANDSEEMYYCPRSAIKTFTLNEVSSLDTVKLDIPAVDLLIFLQTANGDPWEITKKLSAKEKQNLIRSVQACGVSLGHAFDSFSVFSDAIFESEDPLIPWGAWKAVAKRHGLDMYQEAGAIETLGHRDEALEEAKTGMHAVLSRGPNPFIQSEVSVELSAKALDAIAEASTTIPDFVDPDVEKQAWIVWSKVAERHGLNLEIEEDALKVVDFVEEVKLEARGLKNQLKYDQHSLPSLRKRFLLKSQSKAPATADNSNLETAVIRDNSNIETPATGDKDERIKSFYE